MLLRLMPGQVHEYWDDIRAGLERALPRGVPDRNARLLYGLQVGDLHVWVSFQKGMTPAENITDGALITYVQEDVAHKTNVLVIYAVWSITETRPSTWIEGFDAIKKFARSMGCSRIMAFSDEPKILQIAEKFGADTEYTLITWEL